MRLCFRKRTRDETAEMKLQILHKFSHTVLFICPSTTKLLVSETKKRLETIQRLQEEALVSLSNMKRHCILKVATSCRLTHVSLATTEISFKISFLLASFSAVFKATFRLYLLSVECLLNFLWFD